LVESLFFLDFTQPVLAAIVLQKCLNLVLLLLLLIFLEKIALKLVFA
jgi:hypothetical protein